MAVRKILMLGNPLLYRACDTCRRPELPEIEKTVADLHDTLMECRRKGVGCRAIAAPQIGVFKRLVYMHIDKTMVFINPVLDRRSPQLMELWDDCLSFPDLLVRVKRHRSCRLIYRDQKWREKVLLLEGSLSELLQHEIDHLDGILATMRAEDDRSFALKSQKKFLDFPPDNEPA